MQILGLDIGFSRIGFALGNTTTHIAFPREIVSYDKYIQKILWYLEKSEENIEKIVVGMPNSLSGKNSEHMKKISDEIFKIKKITNKFNIPIEIFDEKFTSKIAEQSLYTMGYNSKQQKGKKDSIAATLILQGYLDTL